MHVYIQGRIRTITQVLKKGKKTITINLIDVGKSEVFFSFTVMGFLNFGS